MRKMLDILLGDRGDNPCDRELMEGFQFDPVPERRAVTKAEVLGWADSIEAECAKTRAYLTLSLIEIRQRKTV